MANMNYLSDEEINENKEKIISLLKSTNREGIDNVIDYLNKSGFFYRNGSRKHHVYKGGLAEHSLGVYNKCIENNNGKCSIESIIISSLLHDICKSNYRYPSHKKYGGHGSRSVSILSDFLGFKLKGEEKRAIRFHMGGHKSRFDYETEEEFDIAENEPLYHLVHESDWGDAGGYSGAAYSLAKAFANVFGL